MVVVTPVSICDVVRAECLMCTVYIEFHTLFHTLLVQLINKFTLVHVMMGTIDKQIHLYLDLGKVLLCTGLDSTSLEYA